MLTSQTSHTSGPEDISGRVMQFEADDARENSDSIDNDGSLSLLSVSAVSWHDAAKKLI